MPALITHDLFGQDLYREACSVTGPIASSVGLSNDERNAFLLGNQGPDPLFFAVLSPLLARFSKVGTLMHDAQPSELLAALRRAADILPPEERPIARAYLAGFIGHYALDSIAHPFIFAQEYAICDVGVPGLSRRDGSEVHAVIEGELDEMLLFTRTGQTVATFSPASEILRASRRVLFIVSKMYSYAVLVTYGNMVPPTLFIEGVRMYRIATWLFHSRTGTKREVISTIERFARPHSFYQAMSWRAVPLEESAFENRMHNEWENPFTHETSTASFGDLYEAALDKARKGIRAALGPIFDPQAAREITQGLNFSGKPVE